MDYWLIANVTKSKINSFFQTENVEMPKNGAQYFKFCLKTEVFMMWQQSWKYHNNQVTFRSSFYINNDIYEFHNEKICYAKQQNRA